MSSKYGRKAKESSSGHTRREFLKLGGRAAVGGGIGAYIGNVAGGVFEYGRDQINRVLNNPLIREAEKLESKRGNFWRGVYDKVTRADRYETDKGGEQETVSRRNFFRSTAKYFTNLVIDNPVESGTIVGGAYGAKKGIGNLGIARKKVGVAKLRDENNILRERVETLEKRIDGPDVLMLLIAGFGLIYSSYVSLSKITGYSIQEGFSSANPFNALILIISFFLIVIVFERRKK